MKSTLRCVKQVVTWLVIFAGADCSQKGDRGFWESITYKDLLPDGSASHCSIVWKDSLYVVGGESFHRAKMIYVYDYNGNVWETPHVEGKVPLPRYAHSCVLFGDKIFMYGGVVQNSTVTNEIWAFDVSAKVWENVTVHDNCHNKTICGPLKVTGQLDCNYLTSRNTTLLFQFEVLKDTV